MAEKLIYLEGVDPVDFYGVNNVPFNKLTELFPDIKIVSRGNEIRINGGKDRLLDFEDKVNLLVRYLRKFQTLTVEDFEPPNCSSDHYSNTIFVDTCKV